MAPYTRTRGPAIGKKHRIVSGDSPVLECKDNAVERNPGPGDVVPAVALLHIVPLDPNLSFSLRRAWCRGSRSTSKRIPAIVGLMAKEYVEERNVGYYLAGTRISLDSIVQCFNEGLSPETILGEFETLTLAQVFGAITSYLENQLLLMLIEYASSGASRPRDGTRHPSREPAPASGRSE